MTAAEMSVLNVVGQVKMTDNNLKTIPLLKAKESSGKIALQNVN